MRPWSGLLTLALIACQGGQEAPAAADAATPQDPRSLQLLAQHCELARPGSAYRAALGGVGTASTGVGEPPIPCTYLTGLGSAENTLGIDHAGRVFVAPVFTDQGVGILRSSDQGATWQPQIPLLSGGASHGRAQPYLFLEPASDRLLFATSKTVGLGAAAGFDLSISDDSGATWAASVFAQGSLDWVKLLAGPALESGATANTIYASLPTPTSTPSPLSNPDHQEVLRSRDGGATWTSVAGAQLSLKPIDHGCPDSEWVIYGDGVVDSDGSVYIGLRRCTHLGVATSHDAGVSWTVRDVPGSELIGYGGLASHLELENLLMPTPLAIDRDHNLYAIWADSKDALQYAVSKDHGETWSVPLAINAPAASHVVFGAITTAEPGRIAIAYYGSSDGKTYRGFIAESHDALADAPSFWTVVIDDHGEPLFADGFDIGYSEIFSGGDLIEIAPVRYAANGDVYAAFVKDMCPGQGKSGGCSWDLAAHTMSPYQGVIGRLSAR